MIDKQKEIDDLLNEGELQYIRSLLIKLRNKSKHQEDYWYDKSYLCFKVAIKKFDKNEFQLAKELLLGYIKLRPDSYEAFPYLARCYDKLGDIDSRDKIYQEILEWAMGDYNTGLDCLISKNNETAIQSLNLCIEKLSFFVEFVPTFYYVFKMLARCYNKLKQKEEEDIAINTYAVEVANKGPQPELKWTKSYNLK
jgi:tetratricopeptide (TPR) repeat protein